MLQDVKERFVRGVLRPAAGRVVGRGTVVGWLLAGGPVALALLLAWMDVTLREPLAGVGAAAGFATMLVGVSVLSRSTRRLCPSCGRAKPTTDDYCGTCGTYLRDVPTELERLANVDSGRPPERPLDGREIVAEVSRPAGADDVLVSEQQGEEIVLYRLDADVWEAVSGEARRSELTEK
jgi:hypothetical protein